MPIAWYSKRWQGWCLSEIRKKEIEPAFANFLKNLWNAFSACQ